jgi:hypothetical protein
LLSTLSPAYSRIMRRTPWVGLILLIYLVLVTSAAGATAKIHVITFGKWISVQWYPGTQTNDDKPLPLKIRPLIVDSRVKEYMLGATHDVTERLFVVRRVFRVNDSLPEESAPRWQWQRGGWLLVDRVTGKISPINLPEFDVFYSAAAWYRDYVAYCGVSDDGKKTYAIVAQISRRKPVLKKPLPDDGVADETAPDSACPAPFWQKNPVRVSFVQAGGDKQTFAIRGHVVDVVNDAEEDEEEGSK